MIKIQELREKRRALGDQVRAIYRGARDEDRSVTSEEREKIEKILRDAETLRQEIETAERAAGLLEDLSAPAGSVVGATADVEEPEVVESRSESPLDSAEYRQIFRRYLQASDPYAAHRVAAEAKDYRERRDLQADNDAQAGFLIPPQQFVAELIKAMDKMTVVRGLARSFTVVRAQSLGAPKKNANASTWQRGGEVASPSKDTTLSFGKRELHPQDATGKILVSRNLLRQSAISIEEIVRDELTRGAGELLEQEFLTGSGAGGEALGLFTASADGIPTSRDVSTGNTTTAVTVAGLRNAKGAIRQVYWPGLRWIGSQSFYGAVYALEDGNNRPLFVESLRVGEVDRVLGFPIHVSEFAPSTFTTGQYVGILGDLKYYWIADALNMELQRLDEAHADTNQVAWIARLKNDAMPVLEEAFARVTLA